MTMNAALEKSKYAVLVVDDDDVDREKVLRLLKKIQLPLVVYEGATAMEALSFLNHIHFNCVILDYYLKDSTGAQLIEIIKNHNQLPTPIIMISGNSDEKIVADVIREGAFDYLPKRNLNFEQLQSAIENGLLWAESEYQLIQRHLRFSQLAEGLPHLVWTCKPSGECDFLNRRWRDYTRKPIDEHLGFGWVNQLHNDDKEMVLNAWLNAVAQQDELYIQCRIRRHDGEFRWFDTRANPQFDESGQLIRWLVSHTDVHDMEVMRQELRNSEQRFHAAFDYAPLGMVLVNEKGEIVQNNPSFLKLLGYASNQFQMSIGHLFDEFAHPDDQLLQRHQLDKLRQERLPFVQYEMQYMAHDGAIIPTQVSAALIKDLNSKPHYLFQIADLSERKRYEAQLMHMAHFDSLTGLMNRPKLLKDIEFLIHKHGRSNAPFAVFFCDLDHFKKVNDGLGHEAGDRLLRIIARRLSRGLRCGDSVARLGGDEFVLILQELDKYESVITVAEKIIRKITKPIRLAGTKVHVGISIGVALYPTDGTDAHTLLRNADSALYDAKQKGRGGYQFYRKELTEWVHRRLVLDTDLRKAIDKHEFEVYFQPVTAIDSAQVISAEALVRWNHPQRGLVMPDEFIGYAQESGLITQIDTWVMDEAIRSASQLHQQGFNIKIAVNITARQFHNNTLCSRVAQALHDYQFPATSLIIEITEQMFLENTEKNLEQVIALKALGVNISLDDFGVGYSSLSYIIRFAPHYLKIDRSFVERIGKGFEHDEMVRAIIGLSRIIPMQIIAEGVETPAQHAFLKRLGCHLGQGFLYAKPLAKTEFASYLLQHNVVDGSVI